MKYQQLIIYYFSGTGNAKNAARWIVNAANEHGLKTHLINIDRFKEVEIPDLSGRTLIGFCAATHGFNLPPIMLSFIHRFPRQVNTDAFILNTRAGLKMGKTFIPGLSGLAQFWAALILRLKGFRIVGMQPLDMPSNWIILHPGLKPKVINSIFHRCKRIVTRFAEKLFSGKSSYKALLSLPFDILVIPIAIAYYFMGRFFLAKTLVASYKCNLCNICINSCPVKAITTMDNRPFWTYKCESCMRCVNICPQRAIETAHSFVTLLFIGSSILVSPALLKGLKVLGALDIVYQSVLTQKLWSVIDSFMFLLITFLCYYVLHFSLRFKVFNKFIAYTSLSKYGFWRRYKAPKEI